MFSITVQGETPQELVRNMHAAFDMLQGDDVPAPAKPRKAKAAPAPTPDAEDAAIEAELKAPVPPAPATANAVVDAGTGKPVADQPVRMTSDDVKAVAAKLAAKDSGKLGAILRGFGAAKFSEVPKEKLADFASEVMEALG